MNFNYSISCLVHCVASILARGMYGIRNKNWIIILKMYIQLLYMYNMRAHRFNRPNVGILLKIHHHNIFRDFSNPTKYFTTNSPV